jgi:hypothetical protein
MRQEVVQPDDRTRTVSRHSLAYILCAISELFRHYDFDPLDLLIIHAVLNGNVINVMRDQELDRKFAGIDAVEPDAIKQGVSRAALSRFLNLPLETVRRRADRLRKLNILADGGDGLIVTEKNAHRFGNNHHLQTNNMQLMRKLLRDLQRAGIHGPDDL